MPNWKKVIVSGSDAHLKTLNITNDTASSTVFSVDGTSGRLFSVTDELSGSLFAVSDISGIPSFEVFSDDIVNIGTHNSEGIIVSGSAVKFTQVADTSETKSLMIDSDGVISTRDLGSNAFNSTSYGTGTVDTSGTPVDNDFAKFTDSNTIEGRSASEVRSDLSLVVGTNVQAYDAGLNAIAGLATTDGGFIVGNGSTFVLETGATARTSLGLGSLATLSNITTSNINSTTLITSTETFEDSNDTKIATVRAINGAGFLTSINNGNWSGTDLAVANGGTGASTAANARTNLGLGNVENTALSTYTGNGGALDNQYITNGAGYITNSVTSLTSLTSIGTLTSLTVDDITINGSTISDADELTLDAGGAISLDSAENVIALYKDGSKYGSFSGESNGGFIIKSLNSDRDMFFKGSDGGTDITALTLDMSNAGAATFNSNVKAPNLSLISLSAQNSEATSLMISSTGVVGTRELGANAFTNTNIPTSIDDLSYGDLQEVFTLNNTNLSEFNNDLGTGATLSNGVDNRVVTATGTSGLNGEANLTFNGTVLGLANGSYRAIRTANGSLSYPSFAASNDTNTGIYFPYSDNLSIVTGGASRGNFNTSGLTLQQSLAVGGVSISSTSGTIRAGNDIVAFYSSDKRLKENIKPIENALDKVSKINGVTFDWIEDMEEFHPNEGNDVGVIAQEIEKVLPEVVETRDNGYKAVKYDKIVPLLIESIKDLKAEIEELKGRL